LWSGLAEVVGKSLKKLVPPVLKLLPDVFHRGILGGNGILWGIPGMDLDLSQLSLSN
jgi:hypothetical protein